jgi:hypothetical protein
MRRVTVSAVRNVLKEAKFDPRAPKMAALTQIGTSEYFRISAMEKIQESALAEDWNDRKLCLLKAIQLLVLSVIFSEDENGTPEETA